MRILFITSTRIGDAVLSTGILASLKDDHPNADITVVCGPVVAPLFAAMPSVNQVIALKKKKFAGHWFDLWRQSVAYYWDIVVDLRGSAITWFLLAGKRFVAGRVKGQDHKVITLSKAIGLERPADPRIEVDASCYDMAGRYIGDRNALLAICPTANWMGKTWPAESFLELVRRLTKPRGPFAGNTILLLGGPGEEHMAAPLVDGLGAADVVDLIGKIDLPTAYACLQKSAFFIGNDSGLMHLAAAAGIPTLGLFGPSPDRLYAPWGKNCRIVRAESFESIINRPDFDHRKPVTYMKSLTVEVVENAVIDLLAHVDKNEGKNHGHL